MPPLSQAEAIALAKGLAMCLGVKPSQESEMADVAATVVLKASNGGEKQPAALDESQQCNESAEAKVEALRAKVKQQHKALLGLLSTASPKSDDQDKSIPDQNEAIKIRLKLQTAIGILQDGLVERDVEVRLLLLAAMAGENILLIGPPGTGKSAVGRRLSKLVQGSYFERLLTKFSVPEELFGPLSMHALEQDKYVRQTHGYLPEAEVAFIDEIFKANSSILNTLLTLFNEKLFDNGSHRVPVPLLTAVAASNELPETEELDALFDRFLIRRQVEQVSDNGLPNLLTLSSKMKDTKGSAVVSTALGDVPQELQLSQEDIRHCRAHALGNIGVPDAVKEMLIDLRRYMQLKLDPPAYISDRRLVKAIQLLQVAAFCNGRNTVSPYDCWLLQHVLWQQPKQAAKISDWLTQQFKQAGDLKSVTFLLKGLQDRSAKARVTPEKVAALLEDVAEVGDLLTAKYREILGIIDGNFSPLKNNLFLGADDTEALVDSLRPGLDRTKKEAEALMEDLIRLQISLTENIDVQALEDGTPPQLLADETVAFSGFRDADWDTKIISLGGTVKHGPLSSRVTLLVADDVESTATKVAFARFLGIKVMSQEEFEHMYMN